MQGRGSGERSAHRPELPGEPGQGFAAKPHRLVGCPSPGEGGREGTDTPKFPSGSETSETAIYQGVLRSDRTASVTGPHPDGSVSGWADGWQGEYPPPSGRLAAAEPRRGGGHGPSPLGTDWGSTGVLSRSK